MRRLAALAAAFFFTGLCWAQKPPVLVTPSPYTELAEALFNMRDPGKLERVRKLLDSGVSPNGDHGGWGRAGALGHTRRGENDVIALLLERGATLSDNTGRGPLAIAVEMEREDLALALLRRDGKVLPQDRHALPLAARRGWNTLVPALLQAGADPNATDNQGNGALALAERRRDEAMAKALAAAGARKGPPVPRPVFPVASPFGFAVANEIDDTVFFDPPRFSLTSGAEGGFAFYGDEGRFVEVKCERSISFGFIAMANIAGGIKVGLCAKEAKRVRQLTLAAGPALERLIGQLAQGGVKPDRAMLEKAGWTHSVHAGPGGTEEYYFALVAVGHGLLTAPTVVLLPKGGKRAILVQAETHQLCENYGIGDQIPLCGDARSAMTDLARRIAGRFPN